MSRSEMGGLTFFESLRYDVTPQLRFAMVDDPDGNTILLSAFESQT